MAPYGLREFSRDFDVSRETSQRLEHFVALLEKWNERINLVSKDTLNEVWRRHIADSAQLANVIPPYDGPLVDIGSGAGLPGMILAVLGFRDVHLIESNSKKCAFLVEAARVTGSPVKIHNLRLDPATVLPGELSHAGIITSRAVAPLTNLLDIVLHLVYDGTCCVFPKGVRAEEEIGVARRNWEFSVERAASKVEPGGVILTLQHIRRRGNKDAQI